MEPASESGRPSTNGPSPAPDDSPPPEPQFLVTQRFDSLFVGPEGLRWGWRLLVYFVLREIVSVPLGYAVAYTARSGVLDLWTDLVAEFAFMLGAAVPALIMAPLEARPFGDYGLPGRKAFGKFFWTGAAWGIGAMTLLMLVLRSLHVFFFGQVSLHGARVFEFAGFWGLYFLLVGFAEEFLLRGYSLFTLSDGIGFWPAAIALSATFGAIHYRNSGETIPGLMAAGVIGLFFCLTLRRTGSLWFAVGFHAAWDWGESFFYSVPDSGTFIPRHLLHSTLHGPRWLTGGSVGPEASVLLFVLIALLWFAFDRVYPDVRYAKAAWFYHHE